MRRTLVVTNDFPPRQGGIQSFVHELRRSTAGRLVVVYASDHPGSARVRRRSSRSRWCATPTGLLRARPRRRGAGSPPALRDHDCTAVWFGAAAPLGLLAPALRRAGAERVVATTHGHEAGWAMLPGARQTLRRIGAALRRRHLPGRVHPAAYRSGRRASHPELVRLTPGVDVETFSPGCRRRRRCGTGFGLGDRPVIVCVSRLVPRKGQDALIRALARVRRAVPDAALLLVGAGPYRDRSTSWPAAAA